MRYSNASTRRYYERDLKALSSFAGVDHPGLLTESVVLAWCGQGRANNTVRNTLSRACTFLRWCVRQGEADVDLVEALMSRDNPLRQIPRLYGKVQAPGQLGGSATLRRSSSCSAPVTTEQTWAAG
ncbi:MAG: hypothetical protein ACYC1D_10200 [Acidimicrobiales bacterium]